MATRRLQLTPLVAAVAVLTALTVAVLVADGPLPGEIAIIRRLQDLGRPVPTIADVLRATTGTEGNLVVGGAAAIWLVRRHGRRALPAIAVALVAMIVVQPVTKELVDRDRPAPSQVEVRAEHTSRSYPSGHSLSTATVWGTAALYLWRAGSRHMATAACAPIAFTAVASGVQGVHWASDAVAGTIIGVLAAWWAVTTLDRP